MDSLRKRLEALLEKDLQMNKSSPFVSESPMLNQDLDVFSIETPLKLKDSTPCYYNMGSKFQPREVPTKRPEVPSISSTQFYGNPKNFGKPEKKNVNYNFGSFFSEPTPIRMVSDSPLVTPLRFCPN